MEITYIKIVQYKIIEIKTGWEESMANYRITVRKKQAGSNKQVSSGDAPEEVTRVQTSKIQKPMLPGKYTRPQIEWLERKGYLK